MALSRSDYSLSNLYKGNWDPTNPRSFLTKAVGTVIALTVALFLFISARDRGVPMMNMLLKKVGLGKAATDGSVEVF